MPVAVELHRLPQRRVLDRELKERGLPVVAVAALRRPDDRPRVDPFVDMEGDRRDLERRMLGLPRPHELRVEVRVVGVGLCVVPGFGLRTHETCRRVIQPADPHMVVLLNVFRVGFLLSPGHRIACVILVLNQLRVVELFSGYIGRFPETSDLRCSDGRKICADRLICSTAEIRDECQDRLMVPGTSFSIFTTPLKSVPVGTPGDASEC